MKEFSEHNRRPIEELVFNFQAKCIVKCRPRSRPNSTVLPKMQVLRIVNLSNMVDETLIMHASA